MEIVVINKTLAEGGNGRLEASPPRADGASVSPSVAVDEDGDIHISLSKPYTTATVPPPVKVLPKAAKEVWVAVFNENVSDKGDISASKIAWTAVKNKWKKNEDGDWVEKSGAEQNNVLYEDDNVLVLAKAANEEDEGKKWSLKESDIRRLVRMIDAELDRRAREKEKQSKSMPPVSEDMELDELIDGLWNACPSRSGKTKSQWFGALGNWLGSARTQSVTGYRRRLVMIGTKMGMKFATKKSEDLDENIRLIREAWYSEFKPRPTDQKVAEAWVQRVFDDALIVEQSDGLYRYPYMMSDGQPVFGKPEKVEIDYKVVAKRTRFFKADEEKRLVYGVVMEPNEVDSQGDATTLEEIELACHRFMLDYQNLDHQHQRLVAKGEAAIVECYVAPQDLSFPNGEVTQGSWVMVTKLFSDDLWNDVKKGELTGYSIKGRGVRTARQEE